MPLLHKQIVVMVLVALSCPTLWCLRCLPGSSVHRILQARILEWVVILLSRGTSQSRDWTWVFCIAGRFFTVGATSEAWGLDLVKSLLKLQQDFFFFLEFDKLIIKLIGNCKAPRKIRTIFWKKNVRELKSI